MFFGSDYTHTHTHTHTHTVYTLNSLQFLCISLSSQCWQDLVANQAPLSQRSVNWCSLSKPHFLLTLLSVTDTLKAHILAAGLILIILAFPPFFHLVVSLLFFLVLQKSLISTSSFSPSSLISSALDPFRLFPLQSPTALKPFLSGHYSFTHFLCFAWAQVSCPFSTALASLISFLFPI